MKTKLEPNPESHSAVPAHSRWDQRAGTGSEHENQCAIIPPAPTGDPLIMSQSGYQLYLRYGPSGSVIKPGRNQNVLESASTVTKGKKREGGGRKKSLSDYLISSNGSGNGVNDEGAEMKKKESSFVLASKP